MARKKKPVIRSRDFEYVAFWDEVAWVAGPTGYYYVSQGDTLERAVDNLKGGLQLTAMWCQTEGKEPFTEKEGKDPPVEFSNTEDCVTAEFGLETKGRRYVGSITVEWNENEPGWEKKR